MSNKSLLKFGAALVVLAAVLIFLGVNYVPRIFASSSPQRNTVFTVNQSYILHSHYHNAQYQRTIVVAGKLTRPHYIDERYPRAIVVAGKLTRPDYIDERYPRAIVVAGKLALSL